ncbi:hypothetical protein D3C81_1668470 [compost metagenome]
MAAIPGTQRCVLHILLLYTPVMRQAYRLPFQLTMTHPFIVKSDIQPFALPRGTAVGNTTRHSGLYRVRNPNISLVKAPILIKPASASPCFQAHFEAASLLDYILIVDYIINM